MIDFNKKSAPPIERLSVSRDMTKTRTIKKKLTKENRKFLKLLKLIK